ncbi:nuclear pore complex protein Nup98-Nup96-like [Armigeres subalbatus]|uniref:nuclear pore complex protein Nup98-Nup96-like n=1 Tax=Armigeres subalbatus TaxID=124917 RepID=UPI002ECFD806
MVICTYFLNNNCRFGSKCNNDHIDLPAVIKSEIDVTLKGNQWPLSCFGPFKERNCVPNFIEDVSFEEIRMMYLEAKMQNNIPNYQMQLMQMINEAKQKMQWLSTTNRDIMGILIEIYNQQDDSSKPPSAHTQANPFAAAPVGGGGVASTANIFGGGTNGAGGFGNTGAGFGTGGNAGSNIFGAAPNQSTNNIFGAGGTTSAMGGNIFAKPAQTTTASSNIFGASALVQQQPASSVFGGPAVFGGSAQPLFASVGQAQPATGGSIFGGTAGSAAASSGNLFAQPFGQQTQGQNLFAAAQSQAQPPGSPFAAVPAPAATNPFTSAPPFAAATTTQPQQNLFASAFNAQPVTTQSPFGQSVQQQTPTQSLFLPAPQAAQPETMAATAQLPFGTATAGVFGGTPQHGAANVMVSQSATVYSRVEDLTKEQLDAFNADRFELGKIPTVPPPKELCF